MDEKLKAQVAERKEFNLQKRKRGRPKKSEIKAKRKGNRSVIGRPKGDAAIINDYKARMLASPKSELVLQSIFNAALDDEHKHQAAAWKMVIDRIAPVAAFEKDVIKDGGRSAIQINISGVNQVDIPDQPVVQEDAIEGEIND
jgi:hypothetical protein